MPLTLLELTPHQLVTFGTIIVVYPLGQAVTVAVFVLFAPLLIEPKLRLTYWTWIRFVILVKKEQKNDRRTKKIIKNDRIKDYANRNKILQYI